MPNDVVCENSKSGTPESTWQIWGDGDSTIRGFATDISVNRGQTIAFKINTDAADYHLDIYRLGYYAGNGARFITTINPSVPLPQSQPACLTDSMTHLYDCGNWGVSASWAVPADATSGVYFALLTRSDTGGKSQIVFIVRNDSSHSDVLYQTSDTSWQAYNAYGGNSLYGTDGSFWDINNRAYKVSYNRPFSDIERITWVYGAEYPMIRWLESNGYDVTYFTDIDSDRNGSLIQNHKMFLSSGHDEYWSGAQRANVEAARDTGVNLAFFSGNEVFWKIRWEASIDGSGTAYRTLVCYKETFAAAVIDPMDPPTWTGTWRDPRFSPPSDGGRPGNLLTGTSFMVNGPNTDNNGLFIQVPAADGKMRFWRNTSIANQPAGATAALPPGTLGYEWDTADDNGFRPAGLVQLSTATYALTASYLLDYGGVFGAGTATHHLTLYRAPSGALVFGAGTVQWSWGLDSDHTNTFSFPTPDPSTDMRQATVNLFADMGVQPATIQAGLLLATKSTDTAPPVSTISSPASGATVTEDLPVTISGTATDVGGGVVGGVEVSIDGGATWHPATGRESWTYTFRPTQRASLTVESRAVDDSGNLQTSAASISLTVVGHTLSGNISTAFGGGSGALVTLGGAATASTVADGLGNYSFGGLDNGDYTITPSETGYYFISAADNVTISGSDVGGVNFTAVPNADRSILGSVAPAAIGGATTITISGAASLTISTDSSGNFSAINLPDGVYTLTPSKASFFFSPASASVTLAGGNVSGVTFQIIPVTETLFTTQVPSVLHDTDNVNEELGLAFQSATDGQITAIRFWKDSNDTGTHTGKLWSNTGTLLASVDFSAETGSGWQQQSLATPVAIVANTTYVVSVNTASMFYVDTPRGVLSQVINGDLSSVVGNNGLYGSIGQFPTNTPPPGTWAGTNYFRDIVFVSSSANSALSLSLSQPGVASGNSLAGTITLSGPAPSGGAVVALSSDVPTVSEIEGAYSVSDLPHAGSVDWGSFGPDYTVIPSGTVTPVSGIPGLNMTISNAAGQDMEALRNCSFGGDCAWYGNFADGARVLWVSGTYYSDTGWWAGNGPLTLQFDSPQRGIGFQAMGDETGPFTATICAYNASGTPLGCVPFTGTGSGVADGSATFLGIYDDAQEISKVTIDAGGQLYPHDFGIAQLFVTNTRRQFIPSSVTVPAGASSASFAINAPTTATPTTVHITATYNLTLAATLTINPADISSMTVAPSSVAGGNALSGTVTLTGTAPAGGARVALSANNPVSSGVQLVNSSSGIPHDHTVTWTDLGPSFTAIDSGTVVPIPGAPGSTVTVANSMGAPLYVFTSCPAVADCGWSGNFVPAAPLLWVDGSYDDTGTTWTGDGPLTLTFNTPQRGVGFDIMADEAGPFSGTVCAYNSANTLLGCEPFNGTGAAFAGGTNGVAIFAGIYDDTAEITRVTIDAGGAAYPHDFAIDQLVLATSRRMVPATVTVQPGTRTATFTVNTDTVSSPTNVTVTGHYHSDQSTTLTVNP